VEKNLTHFGRYFIDALAGNNADVDKNGRVSVFEAFSYAARKVEEYYKKDGSCRRNIRLSTRTGPRTRLPCRKLGSVMHCCRGRLTGSRISATIQADLSPEAQALAREAQSLEKQIELLKSAKDEMSQADYEKKLEICW